MEVTIADVAENHRSCRRFLPAQALRTAHQELPHAADRNRDIMLDARTFVFLRLRDRVTGAPERFRLGEVLGDHGIRQLTGLDRALEKLP